VEIERRTIKLNLQIAPLIDIIFNLLLFFMLSYQIGINPGIKITLPMAKTAQLQKEENIIVSITKENKIFLNEHQIGIDKLKGALEEKLVTKQNKTVILKADEKIDLGLAVKVMDIAKEAQAQGIVISTILEKDVR